MSGFESMPSAVPAEKKKPELSPEDQAVMSRRGFLKAAGAVAVGAALEAVPQGAEAQEHMKNVRLRGFSLTEFQKRSLSRKLESLAPGGEAEFTLNGPGQPVGGERMVWVNVIVMLKNGEEKRGKGTAFFPATPDRVERIAREALEDAFEQR